MTGYRIYFLGLDGYFIGAESITCPGDGEAVETARQMLHTYPAVEVWSGDRKVEHLESSAFFQTAKTAADAATGHD